MKNFTLFLFLHFPIQNSVFAKVVQVCTGDVTLASLAEVDAFNCEEITGTLTRLNPTVATIQLVNVVPRLDPNNTPSAFRNVIVPASANANTSSDTTELLCTMAVSRKPPLIALGRLCVYFRKNNLNALPENFSVHVLSALFHKERSLVRQKISKYPWVPIKIITSSMTMRPHLYSPTKFTYKIWGEAALEYYCCKSILA